MNEKAAAVYDLFISYRRQDAAFVDKLQKALEKKGLVLWRDVSNVKAGDVWPTEFADYIHCSKVVLLIWSRVASQSKWVSDEISSAKQQHKKIIPVLLDDTPLPLALQVIQAITHKNIPLTCAQILEGLDKAVIDEPGTSTRTFHSYWKEALVAVIMGVLVAWHFMTAQPDQKTLDKPPLSEQVDSSVTEQTVPIPPRDKYATVFQNAPASDPQNRVLLFSSERGQAQQQIKACLEEINPSYAYMFSEEVFRSTLSAQGLKGLLLDVQFREQLSRHCNAVLFASVKQEEGPGYRASYHKVTTTLCLEQYNSQEGTMEEHYCSDAIAGTATSTIAAQQRSLARLCELIPQTITQ